MLIVTVMLAVIFGLVLHFTRVNFESNSMQMLQHISGRPIKPGFSPDTFRSNCFVLALKPWGGITAAGDISEIDDNMSVLQDIYDTAAAAADDVGILEDYELRFLRTKTPDGYSIAFADISAERATLRALAQNSILVALISFLLFLLISILLAKWAIKPVEKSWNQQRQFIADASHELKTPLTVIITNAELLQSDGYSDAEKANFSQNILSTSKEMRVLAESMLELARADNGSVKSHFETVDLSRLVSDALLPFEPVFFEKGLTLQASIDPELTVNGSETHLLQLADILLDNAQKYASTPGDVVVSLRRTGKTVRLTLENHCDPVSREDLKNIFDRFYRIDKSRTKSGSYGLGLSIAKSIAQEHGAQIRAEYVNNTICFIVEFPAA
jgi:signal transduction histidine kinase